MNIRMLFDRVFLKFLIVGIINTLVGLAIGAFLLNVIKMGYWFSTAANYFLSSILSFYLNKYFTFRVQKWSVFMVVAFIVTIAVSYYLPFLAAKHLVNYFFQDYSEILRKNIAFLA
ncbi:MAG: GtrA family protein, partial [Treponema sp.]|nr:GtrA family protein [Treponema sp.]